MRDTASSAGLTTLICYGLITALAVAYIVARAVLVPITYDEAATFFRYINARPSALFDFSVATNHFLNTVLTRVTSQLLGDAPWALRLPNVLAGVGYLVFAGALIRRADGRTLGLTGFVLMVANPYLLDYFALSRGYGLALGLLMGSLYFLLRWLEQPPDMPGARRFLAWGLGLAAAAAIATFTVLPAFIAVVVLVTARLAWTPRRGWVEARVSRPRTMAALTIAGWLAVAGLFSLLVFARHPVLSQRLFVPISVRVIGLFDDELAQIGVSRRDTSGRWRRLDETARGVWSTGDVKEAWGLRIELPQRIDANVTSLEVQIGTEVFRRDRREAGPWQARDSGADRALDGTGPLAASPPGLGGTDRAINWGGSALSWRVSLVYTAVLLAALAAFATVAAVASALAVRLALLDGSDARLVLSALMAVVAFSAAPLYLLRRDGQLYFGGTAGLVPDTFGSLIGRSAYPSSYVANQRELVLLALAVLAVVVVSLLLVSRRLRTAFTPPAGVLAIVALVATEITLQHRLLGTPWLTGRTALFLLPLLLTFLALSAAALARIGSAARTLTTAAMVVLAAASAWHTISAANVSRTLDWPDDAATPAMLHELAAQVAGARPHVVRLGVDWMFYPAARYYTARMSDATTYYEVDVMSDEGPSPDFLYTAERLDRSRATLVRGFSDSPAALWRLGPGPGAR